MGAPSARGRAAPKVKGRGRGASDAKAPPSRKRKAPDSSSNHGTGSSNSLLGDAAEAVVESLCTGLSLNSKERWVTSLRNLRDAFLAENPDETPEAAARCAALRAGFAASIRKALSATSAAASLTTGRSTPRVRVEVRGTAGRTLEGTSFVIGRGAESDVQAFGDATVSRLQLIVISVPQAIVVLDAWSASGTRTIQRFATEASAKPSSTPSHRAPFVLSHNERAILQIGMKTKISLGLSEREAADRTAKAAKGLIHLAGELTPVAVPPTLSFAPTLVVDASVATTIPDVPMTVDDARSNPPLVEAKNDTRSNAPPVETKDDSRSKPPLAKDSAAADMGRQISSETGTNTGNDSKPVVVRPKNPSPTARVVSRHSINVARIAERTRSIPARRSQLVWRCRAGARHGLLSEEQCVRLEERVQSSHDDLDDISQILDGLGIPPAPKELYRSASGTLLNTGMRVRIHGLLASPELNGARGTCKEWLPMRGRWAVTLASGELKALRPQNLSTVPDEKATILPEGLGSGFSVVKCPGTGCDETWAVSKTEARTRLQCLCGAHSICSGCGISPFHFHGQCADIPKLRARWRDWLQGRGRDAYRGLRQKAAREAAAQRRALQEVAEIGEVALPAEARRRTLLAARAKFIKGEGVRHFFTSCTLCGSGGTCIVGPRFQCLHCPSYDVCLKCEPRLAAEHDKDHVFQILFECEFDWGTTGVELPVGTHARLRQHPIDMDQFGHLEAVAPTTVGQKRKLRGYGLEGVIRGFKRGKYDVELLDIGAMRHVLPQDLQPLLTQKQAQTLLEGNAIERA